MVNQHVIPAVIDYKKVLSEVLSFQKDFNYSSSLEQNIYEELSNIAKDLSMKTTSLTGAMKSLPEDLSESSLDIAYKLMPISEEIAGLCNLIEEVIPSKYWGLPKYYDMLFLR